MGATSNFGHYTAKFLVDVHLARDHRGSDIQTVAHHSCRRLIARSFYAKDIRCHCNLRYD